MPPTPQSSQQNHLRVQPQEDYPTRKGIRSGPGQILQINTTSNSRPSPHPFDIFREDISNQNRRNHFQNWPNPSRMPAGVNSKPNIKNSDFPHHPKVEPHDAAILTQAPPGRRAPPT
ncbi:hypothetical protein TNIN_157061 [Trichonephila inaurata madagascariensis]|uniref:Uncharacterized protein n=1 Tax=Trichonephila inaurata madagascariensis TaxID=2747483 RepID=A0A8X6XJ32_9ARAC|nr:hypothetical protein TNIN_157061 [Trichonephila inaurata madagascariensis]